MKLIDVQTLFTSLLTVSALAITVDANAQNMPASCNNNYEFDNSHNVSLDLDAVAQYCIQDTS